MSGRMGKAENEILRSVVDELKRRNIYYVRVPAGGYRGGMYLGDNVGAPDLLACVKRCMTDGVHAVAFEVGKFVGIEIKTTEGKQGKSQRLAQPHIEKCGGEYWIIRSVDELIEKLGGVK